MHDLQLITRFKVLLSLAFNYSQKLLFPVFKLYNGLFDIVRAKIVRTGTVNNDYLIC
jgi:hypothetical protein